MRRSALLSCSVLLLAWAAARAQPPLAVAMESHGGQVRRASNELPYALRQGDLLFEGDVVDSGPGELTLHFCPAREAVVIAGTAVVRVGRTSLAVEKGAVSGRRPLAVCLLPPIEARKLASVRFYGPRTRELPPERRHVQAGLAARMEALNETERRRLRAELDPVDRLLERDAGDVSALLARAAILHKYRLHADAAEQYGRVAGVWKEVDWPRQLVHEEEDAERRAALTPPAPELPGKTYALVVGISKYPQLDAEQQLQFPHRDATVFAEHLRSPRGGAIPDDRLLLLTEEMATTAAIRNGIATFLRDRAGKQDTVVVFVAAHGIVDSRGAYVITRDSDPEDLETTALPMLEVQRLMEEEFAHVGRVVLYIDICRAGTIGTIRRNSIGRFVEMLLAGQTADTFGLLATRPGEVSFEHARFGGGHGVFSYFLLRGLSGEADENHDGEITAGELIEYVRGKVREATLNQQTPREAGTLPGSAVLTRQLDLPGIQLAGWSPLDSVYARRRGVPGRSVPEALGDAVRRRESFPDAADRLRVSLQDRGQQVLLRYLRGEREPQQRADFAAGEEWFRKALELDTSAWAVRSRTLFCRGRVAIFDKQYQEAIEVLERAARIDPGGAYISNALGIAYLELADYSRAVRAFRDAIRQAPHWVYPVHNLALAQTEQGDYATAIRLYEQAMRLDPKAFYLPYNLGLVYQRLNRRREAEAAFCSAIVLAPGNADAFNALGFLKASSGKRKQAEELYRKALALDARSVPARHNLALLLSETQARASESEKLWRDLLADSPDFLPARLALVDHYLKKGRAEAAAGRIEEAQGAYREALRLAPDDKARKRIEEGIRGNK